MSHQISLAEAVTMTTQYRTDKEAILSFPYQDQGILPLCETFEKSEILDMLAQNDCTKLRIYYGMDTEKKVHAILVGVNSSDQDMITNDNNIILERSDRCPMACPPASDLNS